MDVSIPREEVKDIFDRYGRVTVTSLGPGKWSLTYSDVRDAADAKIDMNHRMLGSQIIKIVDAEPSLGMGSDNTLVIYRVPQSVTEQEIRELFGGYGRLSYVKSIGNGSWVIMFEDGRDAGDAYDDLNEYSLKGSRIVIKRGPISEDISPRRTSIPLIPSIPRIPSIPSVTYNSAEGILELNITGTLRLPQGNVITLTPSKVSIPVSIKQ